MKLRILVAFIITLTLISIVAPLGRVSAQVYTQYNIQVNSDGSAAWTIKQVTGLTGITDTLASFQDRVTVLANSAASKTSRTMGIDNDSLQMSTAELTENSKTTQYKFTWWNFSRTRNNDIYVGDVLAVSNIFNQLYGDGSLQINYPENYTVKSVTPPVDQNDVSTQTLEWFGTQFFVTEKPSIILQLHQHTDVNSNQSYAFIVAGLAIMAVGIAGGFLFVRNQKNRKTRDALLIPRILFETEEEKVLRILRSIGGSAFQSAIMEQGKFSKTKTSELLRALEKKGIVRRVKKGRNKIVSLTEENKSQ
jgi:uncharacterized membrane protein